MRRSSDTTTRCTLDRQTGGHIVTYRTPVFALLALFSLALTGCLSENPTAVSEPHASAGPELEKSHRTPSNTNTGTVTVVHGVPGLTVDVYVNGALTLPSFAPGTVTAPLVLPEDTYDIAILPEGGNFPADAVITGSAFLPAGANASIVAHLDWAGAPTLAVFVNDTSPLPGNKSRVVVRHVAAAPTVDIKFFRPPARKGPVWTVADLSNGGEAQADVRKRPHWATVSPAGSSDVLFTTPKIRLNKSRLYVVYAWGSLDDGTFAIALQTIDLERKRGRR
jgi:hypothetical protein